jgi:antitoxin VapB
MALYLKSPDADRLAREVVGLTGETITDAVTKALEERLARLRTERRENAADERRRRIEGIFARARARAKAEGITPPTPEEMDEIVGYNELGAFD